MLKMISEVNRETRSMDMTSAHQVNMPRTNMSTT
jgi:hypothetical protein